MPRPEREQAAEHWRQQVLARLQNEAQRQHVAVQRLQQRLAFERLLARLPAGGEWILKGGFALQFRYGPLARPTRDIDLHGPAPLRAAVDRLRRVIDQPSGPDRFAFDLSPTARELPGAPGGTRRIRVVSRLGDREFVSFHIDLSSDDAMVEPPDRLLGAALLAFAGIAPLEFPVYPISQHLAEKLHAYTLPREQENTRVKDLADMVLIAAVAPIDADRLAESMAATFHLQGKQPLPERLPVPPPSWQRPFAALMADLPAAPAADLGEGYARAGRFWDPLLAGRAAGLRWQPEAQGWAPRPDGEHG